MSDPREIEPGDQVRQESKPLSHLVKIDKAGALRTLCGVPIRPGRGWSHTAGELSCPTCQAATAKPHTGGHPETPSTISRAQSECVYLSGDVRLASPTGRHIRNVLQFTLNGQPQQPYCTWCGKGLEPAPTASNLVAPPTEC